MKSSESTRGKGRNGSVLVITVVLLAIVGFTLGSMLVAEMTYARNTDATYCVERALFLADAGLRAAVVKLNYESDANISQSQSAGYFAETNAFGTRDWSFETHLTVTNGCNRVVSTGRYRGKTVQVQADMSLGPGNRSVHAIYAHALFAGNSGGSTNYVLQIGGVSNGADYVKGDVYSGNDISLSGSAKLRLPEIINETNNDRICSLDETWLDSYATNMFTNAVSSVGFLTYSNQISTNLSKTYGNGKYDFGEAFRDIIGGDGSYDFGEAYVDSNSNGVWDAGDSYVDRNGNGVYNAGIDTVVDRGNGQYDAGEEWVEDTVHKISGVKVRVNGRWDRFGGYWKNGTTWTSNNTTKAWAAESYEDVGDGVYQAMEQYDDGNGVYDPGEPFIDDRNGVYDYGTQAKRTATGMPAPGPGQRASIGGEPAVDAPDLVHMYYGVNHSSDQPADALTRWGNDVAVKAGDYGSAIAITDASRPEHIFIRNPPIGTSGSVLSGGKTIYKRSYTTITNSSGQRVDDYFLEDPTDSSYNSYDTSKEIDGTVYTAPMFINVRSDANVLLYYVDGNLYIHHPQVYSMRFRNPGTRITIVASGNITLSDEFYYNANYPAGLQRSNLNSSVVSGPSDALCLIALKNPACTNSGNILIGDAQFGTGGSIHAMLYAENDFVDNNLNTSDQAFISVFGNMTAGNQVRINRSGQYRTRLDITLDERIRNGEIVVPGLPHPLGLQRSITLTTEWQILPGTWSSWSSLR